MENSSRKNGEINDELILVICGEVLGVGRMRRGDVLVWDVNEVIRHSRRFIVESFECA